MAELTHPDGVVTIATSPEPGRFEVEVKLSDPAAFSPIRKCTTGYSPELIEHILKVKGPAYLCDEITRDEDPAYVQRDLEVDLLAYFDREELSRKRILDFGCGSGASSMILSRLFPGAEIVGVELNETLLSVARARAVFYGNERVQFLNSPSGSELPSGIGEFDLVILSAVYEHLLPGERETVVPLIWSAIKPGGALFLNMTPHRYFPIEHHTTGLPFINYLPDRLAHAATRRFSKRTDRSESWETLLRRGIRGATAREVVGRLRSGRRGNPVLLEPSKNGLRDRIDLWYSCLSVERAARLKSTLRRSLKIFRFFTGITLVPNLSLVIKKGT